VVRGVAEGAGYARGVRERLEDQEVASAEWSCTVP